MKRFAFWLLVLVVYCLPAIAQASEINHILPDIEDLEKLAVELIKYLLLALTLIALFIVALHYGVNGLLDSWEWWQRRRKAE